MLHKIWLRWRLKGKIMVTKICHLSMRLTTEKVAESQLIFLSSSASFIRLLKMIIFQRLQYLYIAIWAWNLSLVKAINPWKCTRAFTVNGILLIYVASLIAEKLKNGCRKFCGAGTGPLQEGFVGGPAAKSMRIIHLGIRRIPFIDPQQGSTATTTFGRNCLVKEARAIASESLFDSCQRYFGSTSWFILFWSIYVVWPKQNLCSFKQLKQFQRT